MAITRETVLTRKADHWVGKFLAMASPCEILTEAETHKQATELLEIAAREAWRIEHKFSRYLSDNIIHRINNAGGSSVEVDEETARLLDYASTCHELSDGLFDITSGVLRRVWKFDGSDRIPTDESVNAILPLVGWHKASWKNPVLTLSVGMEIDLGGIGKEYAVDLVATQLQSISHASFVVNFGGDLYSNSLRANGEPWRIGLDDPNHTGQDTVGLIQLERGGVATSGDARRFLLRDGIRYSHILNPQTGRPVVNAPRSVMVVADTCVEAGVLSTVSMLKGPDAEAFLTAEGVKFWCER